MMLRVSALPWLTFFTTVRSKPEGFQSSTLELRIAFSMAGIEKEERGVNPLANENHPSLFWYDQDCGR